MTSYLERSTVFFNQRQASRIFIISAILGAVGGQYGNATGLVWTVIRMKKHLQYSLSNL